MNKVLVTGASGFIARHLIERVRKDGYAVRALVHHDASRHPWLQGVEVVEGDIQQALLMKAVTTGCDVIFHLAGRSQGLSERQRDERAYFSVNVEGTRNILEGAVTGGARRFVFFSSVKAMGEGTLGCRDESSEAHPLTAYGRSKLAAEHLALDYGKRTGLHVVSLRLPLVYGSGIKGHLYQMISAIDRGFFPPLPALENRRSMVHVSNAVEAAVLAATSPGPNSPCYIVTDARPYSTRELYELISRELGKRVPDWCIPVGMLKALALAGDALGRVRGRRMLFDSGALDKLIGLAWYSSERIARDLGYHPVISFEEALPDLIAWYRKGEA